MNLFKKIWKYLTIFVVGVISVLTFILIPKKEDTNIKKEEISEIEKEINKILIDKESVKDNIKSTNKKIEKLKKIEIGNNNDQMTINEAIDYLHKIGRKNEKNN